MTKIIEVIPKICKKTGDVELFFPENTFYNRSPNSLEIYLITRWASVDEHGEAGVSWCQHACRSPETSQEYSLIAKALDEYTRNYLDEGEELKVVQRITPKHKRLIERKR
jgi:hypothetical protein